MKRALILAVNWALLITGPIWFGFALWYLAVHDRKNPQLRDALTGKEWFFA
jgi:hypothetical protein